MTNENNPNLTEVIREIQKLNSCTNPVTNKAMKQQVIAEDMRVSGTPLTALSLGVEYNVNGWFFEANLNYYDRVYVDFSEYSRLSNVVPYYVSEGFDDKGNYLCHPCELNKDALPLHRTS